MGRYVVSLYVNKVLVLQFDFATRKEMTNKADELVRNRSQCFEVETTLDVESIYLNFHN